MERFSRCVCGSGPTSAACPLETCRADMMMQYLERLLRLIGSWKKDKRRKDKKTSEDSGFHG